MARIMYTDDFKNEVVSKAAKIGAAAAAREAGVSYQSLLKWMKGSSVSHSAGNSNTSELIAQVNAEIEQINASLKEKKNQLKALAKQLAKEEKEEAKRRAAEEKRLAQEKAAEEEKALLSAIEKSGKSYEELMELLK